MAYLLKCSDTSLGAFELSRLNKAANLRKEFLEIIEEWIEAEAEARFSRWLLERRHQDRSVVVLTDQTLGEHQPQNLKRKAAFPPADRRLL